MGIGDALGVCEASCDRGAIGLTILLITSAISTASKRRDRKEERLQRNVDELKLGVNLSMVMSAFDFGTPACMCLSVFAVHSQDKSQLMRTCATTIGERFGPLTVRE